MTDSTSVLRERLEKELVRSVHSLKSTAGGDAASAFLVTFQDGETAFVKTVTTGSPFSMEALGLKRMQEPGTVRVPNVLFKSDQIMVLEVISFGSPGPRYQEELGRGLAGIHHSCRSEEYGFDADHWIGATPQKNVPGLPHAEHSWAEFWWTHRLEPMFRRLTHLAAQDLTRQLENKLPALLPETGEAPSLIHGDLWSGNVAADEHGRPVLFDPAPSYSQREAEFGMTKLFGGFRQAFYDAYEEATPLPEGWKERQDLYMLYHVLNHAVLFGSGYERQAQRIMRRYV